MSQHTGHACTICGVANAQYGFRLPGRLNDLPKSKRGYLWACPDHREQALARQTAATTITKTQQNEAQSDCT